MIIGKHNYGTDVPPLVIAELSANHGGSLDHALSTIDAVAKAGADAVKLQTFTADTITMDAASADFLIDDPASLWHGRRLYELYDEGHTPWDWHAALFERARAHGMLAFSTPFDESAVDFLMDLDVPCFKIASFEINHIPLIRKAASTGRPLIISCGMAEMAEIDLAVEEARSAGATEICLLRCVSAYPAMPADYDLNTIVHMREHFGVEAGLSDHTRGTTVAIAATALGATVIEKHVTLSRDVDTLDKEFSLEPDELKSMVDAVREAWEAKGGVRYGTANAREQESLQFRRSIYVTEDIRKGELISQGNIRCIRPGYGLAPRFYDRVIGKRATADLKRGTALARDHVEGFTE